MSVTPAPHPSWSGGCAPPGSAQRREIRRRPVLAGAVLLLQLLLLQPLVGRFVCGGRPVRCGGCQSVRRGRRRTRPAVGVDGAQLLLPAAGLGHVHPARQVVAAAGDQQLRLGDQLVEQVVARDADARQEADLGEVADAVRQWPLARPGQLQIAYLWFP